MQSAASGEPAKMAACRQGVWEDRHHRKWGGGESRTTALGDPRYCASLPKAGNYCPAKVEKALRLHRGLRPQKESSEVTLIPRERLDKCTLVRCAVRGALTRTLSERPGGIHQKRVDGTKHLPAQGTVIHMTTERVQPVREALGRRHFTRRPAQSHVGVGSRPLL